MAHALVVGGTGMLRETALWLAKQYDIVSVIALGSLRLNDLWKEAMNEGLKINPLQLDYRDVDHLKITLRDAIKTHGPISLVVGWFNATAQDAPKMTAKILSKQGVDFRYFDVWGLLAHNNTNLEQERAHDLKQINHLLYRRVILGLDTKSGEPHLLSNRKISKGVIKAIKRDKKKHVVGDISPMVSRS